MDNVCLYKSILNVCSLVKFIEFCNIILLEVGPGHLVDEIVTSELYSVNRGFISIKIQIIQTRDVANSYLLNIYEND